MKEDANALRVINNFTDERIPIGHVLKEMVLLFTACSFDFRAMIAT